jgi:signal transduction histidine kinase
MNAVRTNLPDTYTLASQLYLSEREEPGLVRANELGRQAFAEGLGILDIAAAHAYALNAAFSERLDDAEGALVLEAMERFFAEALAPYEMAHRGFWEAHATLRRLNEVLEGQAKRIASALHDEAGQLLASVHFALADLGGRLPADRARDIQDVRQLLDQIEQRLRSLAHELRPPILNDLGLTPALAFLASTVSKRWSLPVTVDASLEGALPATIETTIYRIAQEALNNVARHARASRAEIWLQQSAHQVVCAVRDDGIGIDPLTSNGAGRRGLGLVEIQERVAALGGAFHLGSNQPHGTELRVEIPVER